MGRSTDFKAKYDEGKVFTEYVGPKGWAGNDFKSDCKESISLCELQFGLIKDSFAVGDRSLAGLFKKSANWLLGCIVESRPL